MPKPLNNNIYNLIGKKFSGEINELEEKSLNEWRNSSEEAKRKYDDIKEYWSNIHFSYENTRLVTEEEVGEKIWNTVFTTDSKKKQHSRDFLKFGKVAAVFILFIVAAFTAYHFVDFAAEEIPVITSITKETLPGQKSTISLQDGSIVYLNSGSRLSYKSNYSDSLRILELDGQAFFEVAKDKSKLFIVICKDLKVEALGTSFDINGYRETPTQVSLVTGSVKLSHPSNNQVNELILNPGEYSIVNHDGQFRKKGVFDPEEILAWKNGKLIFKNETISEIVPKLELWFGVTIHNAEIIDQNRPFRTTFERENLPNILMNIGGILNFEYDIDGNNVYLKKKELPM